MTNYGRERTLQEDLEHHFGDMLDDEGPFIAEEDEVDHLDRQYERMDVDDFLGIEAEHLQGQVYRDEENDEAAYFSQWNDVGDDLYVNLETDGTQSQVRGYLQDKFL